MQQGMPSADFFEAADESPAVPAGLSHGLPADAARQLAAMAARGVDAISFTPSGGWVVVGRAGDGHSGYAARGVPDACFVKLGDFVRAGHAVRCVAFAAGDDASAGWVIVSDQAYFASGIPDDCFDALADAWAAGLRPSCVAFAPGGGWALLAGAHVAGKGLPDDAWQALTNTAQGLRPPLQMAFAPGGGWALLAANRVVHQRLSSACAAHLAQVAQAHQVERLAFTPGGGWAVGSQRLRQAVPADRLHLFEDRFRLVNGRWRPLAERLAAHACAGAGLALADARGLRTATRYGSLGEAEWRSEVEAWMAGLPALAAPDAALRFVELGPLRGLVFATGAQAEALVQEMAEAATRLWPG